MVPRETGSSLPLVAAELVVKGTLFTSDPTRPFSSAVAVMGDRIAALGSDALDMITRRTQVVDAGDGLITPGFIDAHVHPATTGLDRLRCSFERCESAGDARAAVESYATEHPEEEWIRGAGWEMSWFERGCPSKEAADSVVRDRPMVLWNADGHGAWVNSKALEIAGVNRETPDPPDGRIERLPDGSPQGTLHEGAVDLVEQFAPEDTVSEVRAGLLRGQQELVRFGITGWQDAWVGKRTQQAYLELAGSGGLVGTVVGALWWDRHRGLEQVDELLHRRGLDGPGFRPTSVKLMLDGVAENFTASTLDPYLDADGSLSSNCGKDFIDPGDLGEIIAALDAHGFQCHFHALGDRAVRNALDAIEFALKRNGPSGNRHHLAHIQFVHPDDIPRFASLDAIANAQALWACNDDAQLDLTKPFVSPERFGWQYPFGALLRAGARLGMGSDWGVTTANVMKQIDVAVTRTCSSTGPLGAEHALTPVEALSAFTAGSAYINGAENEAGMVRPGMRADLAIMDSNPLEDGSFENTRVVMTIIGGRAVFEA